jgi:predicted dehydrogenase
MEDCVRWGILGAGTFVKKRILPAFQQTARAQVIALQRRDKEQAQALAAQFEVPHSCATVEEFLAVPGLDAVFVATPNALHLEHVLAAADAGIKLILCEKPLGISADDARQMVAACHVSGARLFTGHNGRYFPALKQARERLARGELGPLRHLRTHYSFKAAPDIWRRDARLAGGGPLMDLAPHQLDFMRLCGGDPIAVCAWMEPERRFGSGQAEEHAAALLTFPDGVSGVMESSFRMHYRNGFEISGRDATLRGHFVLNEISSPEVKLELIRTDPVPPSVESLPLEANRGYVDQLTDVSLTLLDPAHQPTCATGEDGLKTMAILDALYESTRAGRWVKVVY